MNNGIILGTGNSRYLKSAITEATTWEQFRAALIAGALPIDLAGINADGWQQLATALSKANLLSDATAALINTLVGSTPSTPDAALSLITGKAQTLYNERVQIATGSYTGTGTYGSSNPCTLTFGFIPKILIVRGKTDSFQMIILQGSTYSFSIRKDSSNTDNSAKTSPITVSFSGNSVSWYGENDAWYQGNGSGTYGAYDYVAIG